jgi:hypothetical protein
LTNEDLDLLDEGLEYIESVIGEDNGILSSRQIKEALWYYYLNKEETLEWALGMSEPQCKGDLFLTANYNL